MSFVLNVSDPQFTGVHVIIALPLFSRLRKQGMRYQTNPLRSDGWYRSRIHTSSHAPSQTISRSHTIHSSCQKANDITTCINIHTHRYETGEQSHGAAKLTCAGELISKARAGLTFLQSLQNTEALPRKPKTSPQSRHWERPLPITLRCIVSSRSTRRLQHRVQSQSECPCCS